MERKENNVKKANNRTDSGGCDICGSWNYQCSDEYDLFKAGCVEAGAGRLRDR